MALPVSVEGSGNVDISSSQAVQAAATQNDQGQPRQHTQTDEDDIFD